MYKYRTCRYSHSQILITYLPTYLPYLPHKTPQNKAFLIKPPSKVPKVQVKYLRYRYY